MIIAPLPANEPDRIAALLEYNILDTMPEKDYDDITQIAADICDMPISLISIIDKNRQWFKSRLGYEPTETSRDIAFCAHAILTPNDIFIVNDSSKDERFSDNPLVTHSGIGFYAGVPLVAEGGSALGTLCVIDTKPNVLSKEQQETLKALARQIVAYFEVRRKNQQLAIQKAALEQVNKDLSSFAYAVAHDIKSPMSSMAMAADYLKGRYASELDSEGEMFLEMMNTTARTAISMVDGILAHTRMVNNTDIAKTTFSLGTVMAEVTAMLSVPAGGSVVVENHELSLHTSRYMLMQILLNLCSNAIKYNDKEAPRVVVTVIEEEDNYNITVRDNGLGISEENATRIFDLFTTLGIPDRDNNVGTGIGLSTVKQLVEKLGGSIKLESVMGEGSCFSFTVSK